MNSIGMKLTMSTAGACVPAMIAIEPSTAAIVYAGAVESTPIATPSQKLTAPDFSPLSEWDSIGSRVVSSTSAISASFSVLRISASTRWLVDEG